VSFDIHEQPSGATLKAFREGITIKGKVCTQQQLADSIGLRVGTVSAWEQEKNGRLCPAPEWTLIRITWDALQHAEWKKIRPKQDQ
jgi:DNA-binding XRE family transcriptional regulator